VLHGLRAGDDVDRFTARVRANERAIADPAFLDADTLQRLHARIQRWLALSLPLWRYNATLAALQALQFHCHISKYDPARSRQGYYDDGSWTSVSDIGKRFNGEVPTREQYERVEAAHIDTVREMCRESGITTLEPMPELFAEATQEALDVDAFAAQLRRMLRENDRHLLWRDPQLRFYVSVGYDYHVYAGSHVPCPRAVELAHHRRLFPEVVTHSPWPHPH